MSITGGIPSDYPRGLIEVEQAWPPPDDRPPDRPPKAFPPTREPTPPPVREETPLPIESEPTPAPGVETLPPEAPTASDGAERPVIEITTEEHLVIDQAIAALSHDPNVYQRGPFLVTVVRNPTPAKGINRPANSPRIAVIQPPRLRELMAKNASWWKWHKTRSGATEMVSAHPPAWGVSGVAARGEWPGIRHLEAVTETPVLRHDGTILDTPGWDSETGLIYEPNSDFPPIPAEPNLTDARYAAEILLELVADFPFSGPAHKAAWLASLLTPLARFAIDGPCPLFLFDANTPGTGKTKLVDISAYVSTGRSMSRSAYPDSDDEMRKRITSIALAGDRLVLIDNIATVFGGSALDSALTGTTWRDRVLCKSEMTPELPLFTVWYATGNNVFLKGDVLRRIIPCRLETDEERPEKRMDFRIKGDLLKHVLRIRPALVSAALTLLRAHAVAGRPQGDLTPLGSFESWSEVVRAAVFWTVGVDPCETQEGLRANDPDTIFRAAVINGWAELPGSDDGLTVAEALLILARPTDQDRYSLLRDALMEWSRNDKLPTSRVVGNRLKALRGRVVGGRSLASFERDGTQVWQVKAISTPGSKTLFQNPRRWSFV